MRNNVPEGFKLHEFFTKFWIFYKILRILEFFLSRVFTVLKGIKLYKENCLVYNLENYIFAEILLLILVCFRLKFKSLNPSLRLGFKGLNFNLKQTKLSKNPGKNIMSRIFTQGSCINRYYAVLDGF